MHKTEKKSDDYLMLLSAFNLLNKQNEVQAEQIKVLGKSNTTLTELTDKLQSRLKDLEEQNSWLRKQVFGQKSERIVDLPEEEFESLDLVSARF